LNTKLSITHVLHIICAGSVRNVFFPFDILSDTPIDVATEMVKELEIEDGEPYEIANMIDREISALLPHRRQSSCSDAFHTFNYLDDDCDDDGPHHHFRSFSSSSSFQESMSDLVSKGEEISSGYYWLHGMYSWSISLIMLWLSYLIAPQIKYYMVCD